jgi:hypothetical protein
MPHYDYDYDDSGGWGYVDWRPQKRSLELLHHVNEILDLYKPQRPLTLRQIYYRLVAAYGYPHSNSFYGNTLSRALTMARRAEMRTNDGVLLFDAIRDDEFIQRTPFHYADQAGFWEQAKEDAEGFALDRQAGQVCRKIIWVEGAGMVPQLRNVAFPYGVPVFSSGKFDGIQCKRAMGVKWAEENILEDGKEAQPIRVLHLGDHNPSGIHIFEALARDIIAFAEQTAEREDWPVRDIEFRRIALLPSQVTDIAPDVPNSKDNRRFDWMAVRLGTGGLEERIDINPREAWELEALAPDVIARIVRAAIEEDWDRSIYDKVIAEEEQGRRDLAARIEKAPRIMVRQK